MAVCYRTLTIKVLKKKNENCEIFAILKHNSLMNCRSLGNEPTFLQKNVNIPDNLFEI